MVGRLSRLRGDVGPSTIRFLANSFALTLCVYLGGGEAFCCAIRSLRPRRIMEGALLNCLVRGCVV